MNDPLQNINSKIIIVFVAFPIPLLLWVFPRMSFTRINLSGDAKKRAQEWIFPESCFKFTRADFTLFIDKTIKNLLYVFIVCNPFLLGGVEPPTKFSKRRAWQDLKFLSERGCWEREWLFAGGCSFSHGTHFSHMGRG